MSTNPSAGDALPLTRETSGLLTENRSRRYGDEDSVDVDESSMEPRRREGRGREDADLASDTDTGSRQSRRRTEDEEASTLKYGARHLLLLIVPVSLCMLVVVATVLSVKSYTSEGSTLVYIPYSEDTSSSSSKFGEALVNTLVFLAIVVVMTIVLVVLYKYRCYKFFLLYRLMLIPPFSQIVCSRVGIHDTTALTLALHGWLIATTAALVFLFAGLYLIELLDKYNAAMDWLSYAFIVWNFGVMGMVVIHWKGPLRLLQAYHILISALMALIFIKYLPDWTTWLLLGAFVIYDLLAVCCPKGPLRILVETAQERNEDIFPSLIYTSTMLWSVTMADNETHTPTPQRSEEDDGDESVDSGSEAEDDEAMTSSERHADAANRLGSPSEATAGSQTRRRRRRQERSSDSKEESRGAKLGLGDFIFYSVLLGRAANDSGGDWNVILACFTSILIGLCLTLLLLSIFKRALPALPISITFGLIFYFATNVLISPLISALAQYQVFI